MNETEQAIAADGTMVLNRSQTKRLQRLFGPVQIHSQMGEEVDVDTTVLIILKKIMDSLVNRRPFPKVKAYLIGGAASYVANHKCSYTDIDLKFEMDMTGITGISTFFNNIQNRVFDLLQELSHHNRTSTYLKKKYIYDVYDDTDMWSIFSFRNNSGRHVELKFVYRLAREYMFSTDSIKIDITPSNFDLTDASLPQQIIMSSAFGDLRLALDHLEHRVIDTNRPEDISGGGFLKYVKLKTRKFVDAKEGDELHDMQVKMAQGYLNQLKKSNNGGKKFEPVPHFLLNHYNPGDHTGKLLFLESLHAFYHSDVLRTLHHELVPELDLAVFQAKTKILNDIQKLRRARNAQNGNGSAQSENRHA